MEVGINFFDLNYSPDLALGGTKPTGDVPYAQGSVLDGVQGPGINFCHFRVGITTMTSTFWSFLQ